MNTIDYDIMEYIVHHRNEVLDVLFSIITKLGDMMFIWIVLAIILFYKGKMLKELKYIIGVVASSFIVNDYLIKPLIKRTRPYDKHEIITNIIEKQSSYSFPSGHSMTSFLAATILSFYFPKYKIPFYVLATLIAVSRVYVGVHYPSDIIVGAFIGIICGVVGCKVITKIKEQ